MRKNGRCVPRPSSQRFSSCSARFSGKPFPALIPENGLTRPVNIHPVLITVWTIAKTACVLPLISLPEGKKHPAENQLPAGRTSAQTTIKKHTGTERVQRCCETRSLSIHHSSVCFVFTARPAKTESTGPAERRALKKPPFYNRINNIFSQRRIQPRTIKTIPHAGKAFFCGFGAARQGELQPFGQKFPSYFAPHLGQYTSIPSFALVVLHLPFVSSDVIIKPHGEQQSVVMRPVLRLHHPSFLHCLGQLLLQFFQKQLRGL